MSTQPLSAFSVEAGGRESAESAGEATSVTGLDRRAFLGTVGLAAGAAVVAAVAPLAAAGAARSLGQGNPSRVGADAPAAAGSAAPSSDDDPTGADWHIDDMWGPWPRYAHPIPYARAPAGAGAAVGEIID